MSPSRPTAGKRNLEQQKKERAQAKVARKAARRAAESDTTPVTVNATEAEVIELLADLHRAAEAGKVSAEEFEERREQIRRQLEQIGLANQ